MITPNGTGEQKTVIVIDDDEGVRRSCDKILSKAGLRVELFEDGASGLEGVAALKPDLAVVDLRMPGIGGMEVISRISESFPQVIVVVITGYASIGTAVEAIKSGAYDFLPKPFTPDELRMIVNRGLERRQLMMESQRLEVERELLKRHFVTLVSHQLKSPLVAIRQYLDVMTRLDDSPETAGRRREWLERCLKRTDEVLEIIKDWLTLSKVERGSSAVERTRVDLKPLIANILKTYEELAAGLGVTLQADIPEYSCFASGDRNRLIVLFDNLIVNAIKYNKPDGSVTVSAEERNQQIVVSVSDTGIGIPREYREMIFDEFFRVKGGSSGRPDGTGLGLAICRRIISELGGKIEVESEVEVGSTFRVWLPAWREGTGASAKAGNGENT